MMDEFLSEKKNPLPVDLKNIKIMKESPFASIIERSYWERFCWILLWWWDLFIRSAFMWIVYIVGVDWFFFILFIHQQNNVQIFFFCLWSIVKSFTHWIGIISKRLYLFSTWPVVDVVWRLGEAGGSTKDGSWRRAWGESFGFSGKGNVFGFFLYFFYSEEENKYLSQWL